MIAFRSWAHRNRRVLKDVAAKRKARGVDESKPLSLENVMVATRLDHHFAAFARAVGGRAAETYLVRALQYAAEHDGLHGTIQVEREAFGACVLSQPWDVVSREDGMRCYDALLSSTICVPFAPRALSADLSVDLSFGVSGAGDAEPATSANDRGADRSRTQGAIGDGAEGARSAPRVSSLHEPVSADKSADGSVDVSAPQARTCLPPPAPSPSPRERQPPYPPKGGSGGSVSGLPRNGHERGRRPLTSTERAGLDALIAVLLAGAYGPQEAATAARVRQEVADGIAKPSAVRAYVRKRFGFADARIAYLAAAKLPDEDEPRGRRTA